MSDLVANTRDITPHHLYAAAVKIKKNDNAFNRQILFELVRRNVVNMMFG